MNKELIQLSSPAEVSMADEWFDIANVDHFWMEWRFRTLEKAMNTFRLNKPGHRYLEIGCGHGQFLTQVDQRMQIVADGCDLNVFALKKIYDVKGNIFVYNIFDRRPEMQQAYDGIFLLDVIEHIDDHQQFLKTAVTHAKKGGLVIINVPALKCLFSKYDTVAGHKRRYSCADLSSLLHACGVEPLDVRYWGFSLLPVAIVRKLYLHFIPSEKTIEKGFRPPSPWINKLFKLVMKLELLIGRPVLGTSVVAIGRVKS